MIVCLCNGFTDRDIKRVAMEGGVTNGEEAYAALGGNYCCGSCQCMADQLVEDNAIKPSGMMIAAE